MNDEAARSAEEPEAVDLVIEGALNRDSIAVRHRDLLVRIGRRPDLVRLDLRGVEAMDSAGAALCGVLRRRVKLCGGRLVLVAASDVARDALSVFRVHLEEERPRRRHGFMERLGESGYARFEGLVLFAVLVTDTFHHTLGILVRGRKGMRRGAVVEQMIRIGLESLAIVGLIALLVGLTVALQSAAQLRQFGANVYIVDLVAISMTREMGPLMTAIIVAGRSGSSISAELATMVITEEVDALRAMGMQPTRFLVVPRFLGITLTQPLLTVMANVLGIFGGFIIGLTYLELGADTFLHRLSEVLVLKDVLTGLVKSVSFAWIIVFVGAHRGFRVRGGAEGVGIATTSSVVQSIFAVIVADAFFSLIFYFG